MRRSRNVTVFQSPQPGQGLCNQSHASHNICAICNFSPLNRGKASAIAIAMNVTGYYAFQSPQPGQGLCNLEQPYVHVQVSKFQSPQPGQGLCNAHFAQRLLHSIDISVPSTGARPLQYALYDNAPMEYVHFSPLNRGKASAIDAAHTHAVTPTEISVPSTGARPLQLLCIAVSPYAA